MSYGENDSSRNLPDLRLAMWNLPLGVPALNECSFLRVFEPCCLYNEGLTWDSIYTQTTTVRHCYKYLYIPTW